MSPFILILFLFKFVAVGNLFAIIKNYAYYSRVMLINYENVTKDD